MLLVVAAIADLNGGVNHVHRVARDQTLLTRWLASVRSGRTIPGEPHVMTSSRFDTACGLRRDSPRYAYRLCAVIVAPKSAHPAIGGSYRIPTHGLDTASVRYRCTGAAVRLNRC
ncbi:MAG TPA: hypothetical protein VHE14_09065 [Solirubrobacteraceae bacterium]|nr:hypothetical protein [Solirubrobacteraceae bacterium]